MQLSELDSFTQAYIECALWSSNDESDPDTGGDPLDDNYGTEDISADTLAQIMKDCEAFQRDMEKTLSRIYEEFDWYSSDRAGHDFWLTRNGHGTGFWDRSDEEPELWEALTDEAHSYGSFDLYIGDDQLVYGS